MEERYYNQERILFLERDKFAGFDDAKCFVSYFEQHYLPMLRDIAEGKMSDENKKLADFLADDLEKLIKQIEVYGKEN
jgi:hypothetical protein